MVEFLLDENILGLDRYLTGIKYKKIGDEGCPAKRSGRICNDNDYRRWQNDKTM